MAWTGNAICTSFRTQLLKAQHNFSAAGGDTFYIALYDESAILNADTTDYTATGEIVASGYTAGGMALVNVEPAALNGVGYTSFNNAVWNANLTARGALIYNTTTGGGAGTTDAVLVLDFGGLRSSVANVFTVSMPSVDYMNAIIRL